MKNPYRELSPYKENNAHSFKGRTSEIEEMYECFDRNEYLVCHADSGEGKSSIIEAGLIPKMKANSYFPVRISFNTDDHYYKNNIDFDNVICGIIENEIVKLKRNNRISVNVIYPKRLTNSDDIELTNWEKKLINSYSWMKLRYVRITIDNLLYTPVLIFDQFEEVFTNPLSQEWTDKFFKWLQELSTDLCPQRIINELEKQIGNDDFPEINTQKFFKAIFSLRSEYVGKLDYWGIQRHYIPLLKNNRYLLRPLTIKGAKEVITQQDGYDGLNAVADEIIDVIRGQQKGKNYVLNEKSELPCIPALSLSIVCSMAFFMSQKERVAFIQRLVSEKDEDKKKVINSLIESFYKKAVADCRIPSKDMGVIEDILVNNEGNRQRVSSHADALNAIDFSTQYMEKLKKANLIRVIKEYNEDVCIELIHDALCPVLLKRKEQRYAKKIRNRVITIIAAFIIVGIGIGWYLYDKYQPVETFNGYIDVVTKHKQGWGRLITIEGNIYEGLWDNDTLKEGTLDYIDKKEKEKYNKQWKGGFDVDRNPNGFGIMRFGSDDTIPDSLYVGSYSSEQRCGLGRIFWGNDKPQFFGYWKDDIKLNSRRQFRDGNSVYGLDMSKYQGAPEKIDWKNLAIYCDAGGNAYDKLPDKIDPTIVLPVDFIICRATTGLIVDTFYNEYIKQAKRHYIKTGAYHVLKLDSTITEQVNNFLSVTDGYNLDLPPVLSIFEINDTIKQKGSNEGLIKKVKMWLEEVEAKSGWKPILFANLSIYNKYLKVDKRFDGYDLWIARYYAQKNSSLPNYTFWQLSNETKINGMGKVLDIFNVMGKVPIDSFKTMGKVPIDKFNGSYKDFINYINSHRPQNNRKK